MKHLNESALNIISEGTRIEGHMVFDHVARVYGTLVGDVQAKEGSTLILGETSIVEGDIEADTLMVDGYVRGNIIALKRVVISRTGRVLGNVKTPSLTVEFGAYFEGQCAMSEEKLMLSPSGSA